MSKGVSLTATQVAEIADLRKQGLRVTEIVHATGIPQATVSNTLRKLRQGWTPSTQQDRHDAMVETTEKGDRIHFRLILESGESFPWYIDKVLPSIYAQEASFRVRREFWRAA